jgi:hypothetical protein
VLPVVVAAAAVSGNPMLHILAAELVCCFANASEKKKRQQSIYCMYGSFLYLETWKL